MQAIFDTIERVARSHATVLVVGASGTGKELVARAVHDLGDRSEQPFVAVNCAAIPENLIESELFGHERGAFTDAKERRIGKFEAAHRGTLFLDEIGELAAGVQAKFLRALQERRFERVGGKAPIDVDVRVIAATNRNLEEDVASGRFRADLFYRINVVPIEIPVLADRREDVRALAEHFLARARKAAARGPRSISREAVAALEHYPWPGNVRELENAIEHAVALADGEVLEVADLPAGVLRAGVVEGLRDAVRGGRISFDTATRNFERTLLVEALENSGWNQTRAAERLQMTRRALKLKMDRYDLEAPGEP
jgi:DNA-binding NtrC family response regulator